MFIGHPKTQCHSYIIVVVSVVVSPFVGMGD